MIRLQRQVTARRDNRCPAVLILGALKGSLAAVMANIFGVIPEAVSVAGAAAVVGHWHPVFLRFNGGAGLATAVGAGMGLAPFPGLIALLLGLVTLLIIRNTPYAAEVGYVGFVSLSPFLDTTWAGDPRSNIVGCYGLATQHGSIYPSAPS